MKILLIEDEPNVSSFIKRGFEEQSYVVDTAFDGYTGKKLALQNEYDAIVLDVILPHINGVELCKIIRGENIATPILMLTALGTTEDVVTGLNTGADDYLTKPFKFKELVARIQALVRRSQNKIINPVYRIADMEVNEESKEVNRNGKLIRLTPREFSLLRYFVQNKGIVKSRYQIAESVWDDTSDTNSNVVDVYVNYLRNKIDKGFSPKLIHTVTGMGYVFKEGKE